VLSSRQIFAISALFPLLTLFAGFAMKETARPKPKETAVRVNHSDPGHDEEALLSASAGPHESKAVRTIKIILSTLRHSFILKPLLIIILIIIAPSVYDAMFYFSTDVLHFDSNVMSNINVLGQLGSILGQQSYRFICADMGFKKVITISTLLFCANQALRLMLVNGTYPFSPVYFSYIVCTL